MGDNVYVVHMHVCPAGEEYKVVTGVYASKEMAEKVKEEKIKTEVGNWYGADWWKGEIYDFTVTEYKVIGVA